MATPNRKPTAKSKSLKFAMPEVQGAEDVHKAIEVEAYLLAEKRGFQDGDPVTDWHIAESMVNHGAGMNAGVK